MFPIIIKLELNNVLNTMLEEYCFECNSVSAYLIVWLGFVFIGLNNVDYMFHACRMD